MTGTPAVTLADLPWPRVPKAPVLLVPVGSTEQHGPHLPLDVDTVIAHAVCAGAAARRGDATVVAPPVAYGSSGEHQAFPGTVSIGTAALEHVLVEIGRSARGWAGRIAFVNGHGGNTEALDRAVAVLQREGTAVSRHACRHGDVHAGRAETSLLLHLAPERVTMSAAEAGAEQPLAELLPRLRAEGVRAVSPNGVLGDPRRADAAAGARLLQRLVDDLVAELGGAVA